MQHAHWRHLWDSIVICVKLTHHKTMPCSSGIPQRADDAQVANPGYRQLRDFRAQNTALPRKHSWWHCAVKMAMLLEKLAT